MGRRGRLSPGLIAKDNVVRPMFGRTQQTTESICPCAELAHDGSTGLDGHKRRGEVLHGPAAALVPVNGPTQARHGTGGGAPRTWRSRRRSSEPWRAAGFGEGIHFGSRQRFRASTVGTASAHLRLAPCRSPDTDTHDAQPTGEVSPGHATSTYERREPSRAGSETSGPALSSLVLRSADATGTQWSCGAWSRHGVPQRMRPRTRG